MTSCANRVIRFTAPAAVRGGKNSSEKNISSFLIFLLILFISDSGEDGDLVGDVDREDPREDPNDDVVEDDRSALAGKEG